MKKMILSLLILITVANSAFIRDDSTKTVFDTNTNFIWQDNTQSVTTNVNWKDAIDYCENLTLGGYTNWHLPNFNELYSLADKSKYNPAISSIFYYVSNDYYWSSTTYASQSSSENSNAWIVYFYDGEDSYTDKNILRHVRCVIVPSI